MGVAMHAVINAAHTQPCMVSGRAYATRKKSRDIVRLATCANFCVCAFVRGALGLTFLGLE